MKLVKKSKKVGISLMLGISVSIGVMSLSSFADAIEKNSRRI